MSDVFEAMVIDLDNLDLSAEAAVDEINPDAEFGDSAAPVPDGEWIVIPELVQYEVDGQKGYIKNQKGDERGQHFGLSVKWNFADQRLDGSIWEKNSIWNWPNSRVNPFSQTTELDSIYKALMGRAMIGLTRVQKAAEVAKLLQGQPAFKVTTQWEGQIPHPDDAEKTKTVFRGMKKFPKLEGQQFFPGVEKHSHIVTYTYKHPKTGDTVEEEVKVNAKIVKYAKA